MEDILTPETLSDSTNRELPLVEVRDVSMHFRMPGERIDSIKEYFIKLVKGKLHYQKLDVLDHVSFVVHRGESVGILGRNGAGKSTLLRIISGILEPTDGCVVVRGSVVPLLKLGAGFDLNATGRENIFLNGAILGRSKKEMEERYDSIVAFSELGKFMNMPLKNYSSGMLARLGFSIAVDVEPDLLIIDEILAVGDAPFQKKCAEKIASLQANGTTLLLVSHNVAQVKNLCKSAIWIKDGKMMASGDANTVCEAYNAYCANTK